QERLFLFRELICKDVDWTGLGILAYKCFNTLFSNILAETVVTGRATAGTGSGSAGTSVPGLQVDLMELGTETLWRVTLTSLNAKVADLATQDLLEIYNSPEMKRRIRAPLEQLADSKHKTLTSSSGESPGVKPPAAAAVSWSSGSTGAGEGATVAGDAVVGDAEEEAIRVRLRRCLGLLQGVIRGASGVMSAAHAHRGMGLPGEVSVRVGPRGAGSAGLSSASSALSTAGEGVLPHPLPNKYLLEVHPLETVGSVRARLAAANGTCVDNTRMAANGKNIGTDGWTCEEAGIGHKAVLITIVTPNHHKFGGAEAQATRANEDAKRRRADPTRHEGDVIAMQDGLFDELFRLLECAHGLKDHATTKAVLDLLMSLPTQCKLLRRVQQTGLAAANAATASPDPSTAAAGSRGSGTRGAGGAVVDTAKQWEELLPLGCNWHKTVYTLQIVDALLLPAPEVLGAKPWAAETDDFRMGFLQGGGFSRVIQVFMAAPTGGEADSRDALLGHASALRILKMCLFYPPLGGVGVGGGVGTRAGGSRGGTRLAAGRVGGGGRGQGAGVGVGGGGEEVTLLVNRVMPGVAQPTPAARAAMQVSDSDLKQLLDKLVLVSLAAQRRWMESVAAAAAASSDDSSDSITSIKEEREEERLYRQVQVTGTPHQASNVCVMTDCLLIVEAVLDEHAPMMKALADNASARELVVTTLARNPAARLRRQMGQLLIGLRPMAGTLLCWLTGELQDLPLTHSDCDEFFTTMRDIVFENHARSRSSTVTTTPSSVAMAMESPPSSSPTRTATSMTPPESAVVAAVDKKVGRTAAGPSSSLGSSTTSTVEVSEGGDMVLASPGSVEAAVAVPADGGGDNDKKELDLPSLAGVLSAKMMAMPRDGHGSCKAVLQGCLELLRDLVEIEGPDGSLLDGTELGE
ncbi:unnamed protein product, partial [Sphacelaria rigidula]